MKITKAIYLKSFAAIVLVLALTRCIFPGIAEPRGDMSSSQDYRNNPDSAILAKADSVNLAKIEEQKKKETEKRKVEEEGSKIQVKEKSNDVQSPVSTTNRSPRFYNADGSLVKHRIWSVPSYADAFPDLQEVQIAAANKYGVSPVQNRAEAERRKMELVYVGANPYFFVEPLRSSIPYLVPRAAVLLQDIGHNFFDSLQIKGVPLNKIIVTSVLRSKDDVNRLRGHNGNATENSCHLYGTTFDICYNRYKTVADPKGPRMRQVQNDTLKWVLCEVLNDLRRQGRCYVKYEVKQGCFHITTR